ncbi:hypothetical protein ACGF3G_29665 [Streptomyces sp. NPDC048179]
MSAGGRPERPERTGVRIDEEDYPELTTLSDGGVWDLAVSR